MLDIVKNAVKRLGRSPNGSVSELDHPWFNGLAVSTEHGPDSPLCTSSDEFAAPIDLSAPLLFLARGHSGTRLVAKLLASAGVHMGSSNDPYALNPSFDSLYWAYGFQRTLVPQLFVPRVGCRVEGIEVVSAALQCLSRHVQGCRGGPWGFKTCAGMFCHTLYRSVFPRAKYIYLVRDGRDVVLSGNGFFHLTNLGTRQSHWEYFKIITFGISDDLARCPFRFPSAPRRDDEVMQNRFWIQAKSWREHVRMVEHLKRNDQLSPFVHVIRYEDLCAEPVACVQRLFSFLDVGLTSDLKDLACQMVHNNSVGRWKNYQRHVSDYSENMEKVFESMEEELQLLGYED